MNVAGYYEMREDGKRAAEKLEGMYFSQSVFYFKSRSTETIYLV